LFRRQRLQRAANSPLKRLNVYRNQHPVVRSSNGLRQRQARRSFVVRRQRLQRHVDPLLQGCAACYALHGAASRKRLERNFAWSRVLLTR
jgi:hypothetical protein